MFRLAALIEQGAGGASNPLDGGEFIDDLVFLWHGEIPPVVLAEAEGRKLDLEVPLRLLLQFAELVLIPLLVVDRQADLVKLQG